MREPKVVCDTWPRQKCTMDKVSVNRTTPDTKCRQQSRELCANKPCLEERVNISFLFCYEQMFHLRLSNVRMRPRL